MYKTYMSIGHFHDSDKVTCVAFNDYTIADARRTLMGNGFVPFILITARHYRKISQLEHMDLYVAVKKLTNNFRKWGTIVEYIDQCCDTIDDKINLANQSIGLCKDIKHNNLEETKCQL